MAAKPIQKRADLIRCSKANVDAYAERADTAPRLHASSCSSKLSVLWIGLNNSNSKHYFLNIIAPNRETSVETILKTVLLGWAYLGTTCAEWDGHLPPSTL